ncbi:Glycosyltransferase involved in cell wall bisynthesis [Flavobacterium fluvii]|uniref:Glycosyltransferase involved in cell wall bisynthesis n=1 Tax=Flavobacterium fluvii TaxID=468056 RepID=A0A1M5ISI4_9FLAO|nr:glycosyltransferase family 4 protein [Flavobacterium fluvii]SHG30969.1 Glycosyltransferase involved in cell wall bisynthesis [Flavobacterium fluvii]
MQIAFLTPEYPHHKTGNSGGIGTSIKNLARGLLAEGCSVRVLVYGQKEEDVFNDYGIIVQQIQNVKFKGLSWWLTRKKLERIINQLYANTAIDLLEAPDWTGITSFIQPEKCPIVIRLNGCDTYFCHLDNRPVKWMNKFHEKRALQKADGLLSVSQFTADLTNEVFGLKRKFTIIPNSIDVDLFNSNDNSNDNNTILYFGSLIRKKGLLELPFIFNEVIRNNPEVQLVLVGKDVPDIVSGNSSTWAMMQELFMDGALQKVSYLGSVPYQEIKKQIELATVCVFPSFAEALPVSWIEAMAMQKAVVASNIGWAKEIIEDGKEGYLVNPKEHKEYAMQINTLLNNPDLMFAFGKAAREKVVDKFDIRVVSRESMAFYDSIIKE